MRYERYRSVVVTMITVDMMQVAVGDEVAMIPVRHDQGPAGAVLGGTGTVSVGTDVRVRIVDFERMLIDMVAMEPT